MARLNWGMIGGGEGSQIGPAHRLGAGLDGLFGFAAGALDHRPEAGRSYGQRLGLAADRSYGVQVARLAGLPQTVVDRAKMVLEALEKGDRDGGKQAALIDDLPLFRAVPSPPAKPQRSVVEDRIKDISPDELSPIEALRLIYDLKSLL